MDRGRDGSGTTTTEDKSGNVKVPLLTDPIDCPPTPRVFLSSWDRGKKICDYTIVQDDTSRRPKPPVDFKTKVPLWPGQAKPGQPKMQLLFCS